MSNLLGSLYFAGLALLAVSSTAHATTFTFDTDPFAGTNVLNIPGRQVVGGEAFIPFNIAHDVLSMESTVYGVGDTVQFVNAPAAGLPASGVNIVVLQTFDNDANPLTPFGAGNAADLIAASITTPRPGILRLLQPVSRPAPPGLFGGPEQQHSRLADSRADVEPERSAGP